MRDLQESKRAMLERVRREIAGQRLWRAREILQGNISARGYDVELYEEYGRLLLRMGDQMGAGQFLLLSAPLEPTHRDAVALFVGRHLWRDEPLSLYHALPRAARLRTLSDYPADVRAELEQAGLPHELPAPGPRSPQASARRSGLEKAASIGCIVLLAACVGVFLVGLGTLISAIFR